ncbi:DNA gyrase subunit A [Brevibacillus formosus]|uniref:DNA gyrase subunit A n=1 Tax=Brevibacillus TaxID=55080 RepID=UPI000D0E49D3|nr:MULTISPECIES: DNA gyrase subunit A [Brevibacillus]MBG9941968.1 DNA gyrase subunit A [Brevibacillus formosus]MED1948634.1 DNA gyrase subunit A [Brevibacillus formosus]MED2001753.1 DNA gyrase subunit A [Brevibacillus formosus]MED2086010.1 DNA gyrase subunit A [Brevibacillus formosus]PSK08131.1 DNA gyrase subunit A [Brevibacillus sp. NRRL NRS-603]
MAEETARFPKVDISHEMRESFISYAMSVIVSRALPDVRDGLKPVHRRILYAMHDMGLTPDKPFRKSANVVGEVMANYHPHGDSSIYEAMVRMAQDFNMRYMLVEGQGNFGSVDGDPAAAMRYTESRFSKLALELLRDIDKETVDFTPNYDGRKEEPVVLPSRFPNLLLNGASGIAVGMATNIPPHNLTEVIDGVIAMIDNPDITIQDLMKIIKGPDFPTAGEILGYSGIRRAYETGRGSIIMRAKTQIEEDGKGKPRIIVTEIPYQVNKARLVEKIAELVREKKIEGITDLRDESDRKGMRIVMELRRDVIPKVVLNNLFKHTQMQSTFGVNMLALVDSRPRVLNLRDMLYYYLEHQRVIIRRRTEYDLKQAEARAHILEGLRIALDHIDEIISLIRSSQTTEEARTGLMENYSLSYEQAQAILDMRLQRLTGLEREKIENEYQELMVKIAELRAILADEAKIYAIIRDELGEIKEKFGDARRTEITFDENHIEDADLIPEEDVVITLTHDGYIKRLPVSTYRSQKRGGRGVQGLGTKDDDFVEHLYITNSHDYIMFFTSKGKVYRLKGFEIPDLSRTAKGTPIINLIQIEKGERVSAVIPVKEFDQEHYLFFATKKGIIKKTTLESYENIRKGGLIAVNLREDDELIGVRLTDGQQEIIMGTHKGMSVRFNEGDVRTMGRNATGVKGITLDDDDDVIDMDVIKPNAEVLIVTANGYGKRTPVDEYRIQSRGGKGIKTHNVTDRSGPVVGLKVVEPEEDLMIITTSGIIIRTEMKGISVMGRYTQGVKLIRLSENEQVGSVAKCPPTEEEDLSDEDAEERIEDLQDGETVEVEATEPTEPTEE